MNDQDRVLFEAPNSATQNGRPSAATGDKRAEDAGATDLPVFGEPQRHQFESSPCPMRIFDQMSLRYLAVNDAALKLYGYTRDEFLRLTAKDTRHPEEHAVLLAAVAEPTGYLTHWGPRRHVKKSGEIVVAEVVTQDVLFDGRVARLSLTIDLTERNRALELLHRREEEFESLAENLPDLIARFDRQGRYVYVNSAIEKLTGATREAMLGKTQRELGMPEEVAALYDRSLEQVMRTGESDAVELIYPNTRNEYRLCEAFHVPERDAAGAIARVLCVARDITDRKRAEQTLRDNETRFELAVENTGLGMWDWDVCTGAVWRHPRWARILGYEPEEVMAQIWMWKELCHPEDWPEAQQKLAAHFDGETPSYAAEYRMRNKKGSWIWIGCRGKVIERDADGTPLRMVGYIQDVSGRRRSENALRESEERFRQLAENIREVFWINTPEGDNTIYVSPAYEEIWGRSCESLYRDPRGWMEPIHPDDLDAVRDALVRRSRGEDTDVEYRIVRPDGTLRWIRDRSYQMRRGDGTLRTCGIAEDITSRKRAEEQRINNAIHQRDALVREVHHRIKNHLQGIAGLLRNMASDNPAAADMIEVAVAHLQSVAVVYGLQSELAESGVPLCRLLEAICLSAEGLSSAQIARGFAARGGRIRLAETEAVPVAVALNELVFNAIEHGHRRSGTRSIEITLAEKKASADIRIVNRGRLPARFDYTKGIGTGTGLDLVRTLLGPSGNKLQFEARDGKVEVTLSLRAPLVAMPTPAATARP